MGGLAAVMGAVSVLAGPEPEAMPDFPGNGGSAVFPRPAAQPFRRFAFVPVVSLL